MDNDNLPAKPSESQENDSAYRQFFENALEGFFRSTKDGRYLLINPAMAGIFGYDSPEEMKRTVTDIAEQHYVDPDQRREYLEATEKSDGGVNFETRICRRDRKIRWVSCNARCIRDDDGKVLYYEGVVTDITGRKERDEILQRYGLLSENARDILMFVRQTDGRILEANRAAETAYGYAREELLSMTIMDLRKEDPPEMIRDQMTQAEREGILFETVHRRKDGTHFPVEVSSRGAEIGSQKVLLSMVRDNTERKKTEERLRSSEREKAIILDTMTEIVVYVDREMRVIWANKGMYDAFRFTPSDFERTFCYTLHGRQEPCSFCPVRKAMETGEPHENVELSSYEKSWILRGYPVRDEEGCIVGGVEIVTDVTERKKIEQALRQSEEEYRLLVENASDAILIAQDGILRFVNKRTIEYMGYTAEELASRPFTDFIHPDDRNMVFERYARRLKGEELSNTYEFRVINKSGEEMNAQINSVKMNWQGRPAVLSFLRDVTERKRLESRLLNAQKMEAIGTLAGGIAHDFNNLLMGIQGYASLILRELDEGNPVRERVMGIEEQVRSGADLTRQLLGFARGGKLDVRPTDLNDVIRKTSTMFGRTKKEITIHTRLQKDLWATSVDRSQVEQVLMNLYVNAWQAMPGGGSLYLHTYNISLAGEEALASDLPAGRYVRIGVTDTGLGMDNKTKERIFEPFFTTKEMGRGTGLGLATVYGIVAGHGGAIQVYSEKGQGTSFHIYFPASDIEVSKEEEEVMKEEMKKGSETILIVDDEEVVAAVAREMLEHLGYQVIVARSGKEALDVFSGRKDEIDLVLLDMVMPKMGGGETFDQLKAMDPGVRVILSSGYSIDGEARQILGRGCKGFINKPYSLQMLSGKIREVLS
ncbi:MAG: PAS domain S-box protein [Syntrophaceae bacterium]|nr:PAS domain S-box protein [Syntrophaceae bacterium]